MKSHKDQKQNGFSYEIRVKDKHRTYWTPFQEGWAVSNLKNGEVLLRNSRVDPCEIQQVLEKIRDLNLVLLSVRTIKE